MEELFQSILEECKTGRIQIGPRHYNIFLSDERNDIIPNLLTDSSFFHLLNSYVEKALSFYREDPLLLELTEEEQRKLLICSVFVNASVDDFRELSAFLKQRITFFEDPLAKKFSKNTLVGNYPLKNEIAGITFQVKKQSILQETPYQASIHIISPNQEEYILPNISYGMNGEELILYASQNKKPKKETPFLKKVKRSLYQANEGIIPLVEEYYGEDLSQVSPSSLVALTVFLNMAKKEGVHQAKVITYLPERYYAKEKANLLKHQKRGDDLAALENEQRQIQNNITNKWIRNFIRMEHQIRNLRITSYPFEIDSSLHLALEDREASDNKFFATIIDLMNEVGSKKR